MSKQEVTTMSISLPQDLKDQIRKRVQVDHYGTPSDYVRSLIREDLKRQEERKLEKMLLAGLASGPSKSMGRAEWKKLRAEVKDRIKKH